MGIRLLAAAVLAAVVLVPPPSDAVVSSEVAPPDRAGVTVRVEHLMFMPGRVTVSLGEKVTWAFPEITQHTTTSDQGFWDSGSKSGGASYARTFTSAGSYPYSCTFHSTMHGVVRVPVAVTAPTNAKRVLRWSTVKAGSGITFDVQVKPSGLPWSDFRVGTTRPKGAFTPDNPDTYKVRARTTRNGVDSGWSKPVKVTIA